MLQNWALCLVGSACFSISPCLYFCVSKSHVRSPRKPWTFQARPCGSLSWSLPQRRRQTKLDLQSDLSVSLQGSNVPMSSVWSPYDVNRTDVSFLFFLKGDRLELVPPIFAWVEEPSRTDVELTGKWMWLYQICSKPARCLPKCRQLLVAEWLFSHL